MRRPVQLAFLASLVACSGQEEATEAFQAAAAEVQQAVAAAPSSVLARLGGALVPAGTFHVEVLPHRDGVVEALVYDAEGNVVEDAGELKVRVPGVDGSSHEVTLAWDPEEERYVGAFDGAIAAGGEVGVHLTAGGQSFTADVGKLAVAPEAPQRGGTVVVAGDYTAELVTKPDGSVVAYVVDADGEAVTGDAARVQVALKVGTDDVPVTLQWDPQVGAYVGRPQGQVQWNGGAIALTVEKGEERHATRVARVAPVRAPVHGGEVVVAGDYAVEVVPSGEGELKAYVVDAGGAAVADPAQTQIVVLVDHRPVTLRWDAAEGAYKGAVDARLDLAAAPLQVVVRRRGRRHWGGVHVRHAPHLRPWHERRVRVRATLPPGPPPHAPAVGFRVNHPRFRVRPGVARIDVRGPGGRVRVRTPGAAVSLMVPAARVDVGRAGAVRVRGPGMQGVVVGPMGGVAVRGPGGAVRVRAPGGMASVNVRAPGGMASVMVRAPSGMASVRVRAPGAGASVMVSVGGMRRGMGRGMRR